MTQLELLHVVDGKVLDLKCTACSLCDQKQLVTNCMDGEGPVGADFMFVGFAPGKEDDGIGRPMTGENGRLLYQLLAEAGIRKDQCFVTNALRCAPYDQDIKDPMFKACKSYLIRDINRIKPKAIVAVGAQAVKWLTGHSGVRRLRKHALPCAIADGINVFPIEQPAALWHVEGWHKQRLRTEMLDDLMWLKQRAIEGKLNRSDDMDVDYQVAKTVEDVDRFIEELSEADQLSVDFETSALFPSDNEVILAVGFSTGPGMARVIPIYAWGTITLHYWTDATLEQHIIPKIRKLLTTKKIFGHNFLQFDQKWSKFLFGIDRCPNVCFDTMYAHYLIDEEKGGHDLEQLAIQYTTMLPWKRDFDNKDLKKLALYLCKDVDATYRVKLKLQEELTEKQAWLLQELLISLGHELMEMEYNGIYVNKANLDRLTNLLHEKIQVVVRDIRAMPEIKAFELMKNSEFNINSSDHIAYVMEHSFKLPKLGSTGKDRYSTAAWVLEKYKEHPFVSKLSQARSVTKLAGTYAEGMSRRLLKDGRLHTSFLVHGTETGRLASRNPNLSNIPREDTVAASGLDVTDKNIVKDIFAAADGNVFVQADYSQAELRALAMLSMDPELIRIYKLGLDAHRETAAKVYGIDPKQVNKAQRTHAKIVNFGIIYGKTLATLKDEFVGAGQPASAAEEFYYGHKKSYPLVWAWMEQQEHLIRTQGYQETLFGRRRHYKEITQHTINAAYNFPVQSLAADFTAFAMVRISKKFRQYEIPARIVLSVYDSILTEVEEEFMWEAAEIMRHTMENLGFPFMNVPMVADLEAGYTWGTMVEIDPQTRKVG